MKLIDADAFAEELRQRIEREAVHHMAVLGDEVLVMLLECEEADAEAAFWKMLDDTFVGCPHCLIKEIASVRAKHNPEPALKVVRHAFWDVSKDGFIRCSYCGEENGETSDFCPHCGSTMDGGANDGS